MIRIGFDREGRMIVSSSNWISTPVHAEVQGYNSLHSVVHGQFFARAAQHGDCDQGLPVAGLLVKQIHNQEEAAGTLIASANEEISLIKLDTVPIPNGNPVDHYWIFLEGVAEVWPALAGSHLFFVQVGQGQRFRILCEAQSDSTYLGMEYQCMLHVMPDPESTLRITPEIQRPHLPALTEAITRHRFPSGKGRFPYPAPEIPERYDQEALRDEPAVEDPVAPFLSFPMDSIDPDVHSERSRVRSVDISPSACGLDIFLDFEAVAGEFVISSRLMTFGGELVREILWPVCGESVKFQEDILGLDAGKYELRLRSAALGFEHTEFILRI